MPQSFQLVMRSGPTPGKGFVLNKPEIYIGRDVSNDIVINDAEISRKHARLVAQGGGYILEDLGSTNGTYVGGQRLMGPYTLRSGDLILLGENVSLAYASTQFDPDATMATGQGQATMSASQPAFPPERPQEPIFQPVTPPPYQTVTPAPGPAPVEAYPAPEKQSGIRNWLLAGCGCLVLLVLCSAVSLYVIDYLNLWCTLFGFIIPGCR